MSGTSLQSKDSDFGGLRNKGGFQHQRVSHNSCLPQSSRQIPRDYGGSRSSQLDVAGAGGGLEMGPRVPGASRSSREGKKHGFKSSLCPASYVIFSKTADLYESVFSLKIKIKIMKTVTAPTSQCCCIKQTLPLKEAHSRYQKMAISLSPALAPASRVR